MSRYILVLITTLCSFTQFIWASSADSANKTHITAGTNAPDSGKSTFLQKIRSAIATEKQRSEATFQEGQIAAKQRKIEDELVRTAQEVKLYLNNGVDIRQISLKLKNTEAAYEIVKDGIFINTGSIQTERNLSVSSAILYQLILDITGRKKQIDKYADDLRNYRSKLDSLLNDPSIYILPEDSASIVKYLTRLKIIAQQGNPSDNALNQSLADINTLQNSTDNLLFNLQSAYDRIESFRTDLAYISLKRELPDITDSVHYDRPLNEIIGFSLAKEKIALKLYIRENQLKILLLIGFTLLLYFISKGIKNKLVDENPANENTDQSLVLKHPLASATLIIFSIYQFAFINAPFIFYACLWFVNIACLITLFKGFVTRYWFFFWITICFLFTASTLDNLILQASRTERWIMVYIALAGVVYGSYILYTGKRKELKEKHIIIFIRFVVIAEFLSLLLNIIGRYNLAKILMNVGFTGAIVAILFIWTVRLINETLTLASTVYKHPEKKLFYINFSRVGSKVPAFLYVLLGVGWLIIVGRHFYLLKRMSVPFQTFLHQQRNIGSYTFSINGLFLFIIIMFCSLSLSRIISFFSDDTHANIKDNHSDITNKESNIIDNHSGVATRQSKTTASQGSGNLQRKSQLGSWLLLLRIFIISLGLFLALAASGLPLDRLTVVMGALGVGVGLGLQSLVSNLVSGLIIAFESPVNVGDLIEINGKTGYMKSIGFRSSVVSLSDGSSLIVPNGDILNTHVINWSTGKHSRRHTIALGVAYGSDLQKVKEILEQIAQKNEKVLQSPAPSAAAKKFSDSSIDFELTFWVKHLEESATATNDIINEIDRHFKEANISIPFPQREIHWTTPEKPTDQ